MQTIILPYNFDVDIQAFVRQLSAQRLHSDRIAKEVIWGHPLIRQGPIVARHAAYILIDPVNLGLQGNVTKGVFKKTIQQRFKNIYDCTINEALYFYSMTKKTTLAGIMNDRLSEKKFSISINPILCGNNKHYGLAIFRHGDQMWLKANDSSCQEILSDELWVFMRR